ncbi:hypothetical protein AX17_001715 [Amanita inopinata Kibby_2008]|nr:hypothetical protein AX17_001715 [Amanita inopinata Kibby_2008]
MEIALARVPHSLSNYDIVRRLMPILHSEEFSPPSEPPLNFIVRLERNESETIRNTGFGTLTVPSAQDAHRFLTRVKEEPIKIEGNKIRFYIRGPAKERDARVVAKTPFIDPDNREERERKKWKLQDQLRLDAVQFGILFRDNYTSNKGELPPRSFSIEWEHDAVHKSAAWLMFEYDNRLIRITIGDQAIESVGYTIAITFESIEKIGIGYGPQPYICFDTRTPPGFREVDFFDSESTKSNYKCRIASLPGHARVAPYAHQLRLVLYNDRMIDIIEKFEDMCKTAVIPDGAILRCDGLKIIEAERRNFFDSKRIFKLKKDISKFSWPVAFQLEALLHNGLLHTRGVEDILHDISKLCRLHPQDDNQYVGVLLRRYVEVLRTRPPEESPQQCFERVRKKFEYLKPKLPNGNILCYHVLFTPSRIALEGPYSMQSNRVIREFEGYEAHFIRVEFSEEDRSPYRWERQADENPLLNERVGNILKGGFELGGRHFEFLAYSSSSLRSHAVWFMNPFEHPSKGYVRPGKTQRFVNSEFIRDSIGDFKGTELLMCPSKYAARLGQAFTSTDPSVKISREEFEEVDDLGSGDYLHTDGVGTISKSLSDEIWAVLRNPGSNAVQPSAYQIRFLGYKGMVSVDTKLDTTGGKIKMRLRESMRKFENSEVKMPEIEIAQSFQYPNACYLNRPLIMFLEDLHVSRENFERLQDEAVADVRTIHDSIENFCRILDTHSMGRQYRLSYTLKRLKERYGLELRPQNGLPGLDTPFLKHIRQVAMVNVLRDIKYSSRIPIPNSYLLVGVADEGPAYRKRDRDEYRDIFILGEGQIYACIQDSTDKDPVWLEGPCTISRSPVVHPGDIQRVDAIGKPPEDKVCLFSHLKNVVVLPSDGDNRSLASMLGGGDLDGDQFSVIMHPPLLPMAWEDAAKYPKEEPYRLERPSKVEDICDFVVDYIKSDVLGICSDRLLVIADQSKDGVYDKACEKLARLCSKAVDYPKNGNRVDLDEEGLPPTLIREKPDWHATEVNPRKSDHYKSDRALGCLYRAVVYNAQEELDMTELYGKTEMSAPLTDPISLVLSPMVEHFLRMETDSDEAESEAGSGAESEAELLFQKYVNELSYICAIHTISTSPNVQLHEAEVVTGTIVDHSTLKRYRKDRVNRMRNHVGTLVQTIEKQFVDQSTEPGHMEWKGGLERAWYAWSCSQRHSNAFGANSFGLIALGMILVCLEKL